jgi:predicted O-methyltransferase YrrM
MRMTRDDKISVAIYAIAISGITVCGWFLSGISGMFVGLTIGQIVIFGAVIRSSRRIRESIQESYANAQAMTNLRKLLSSTQQLPHLGGFAFSPQSALRLARLILDRKPSTVVEFGSGSSTVVAASCLQMIGGGKIISFEHDQRYSKKCSMLISQCHLEDYATVIHAPLKDMPINEKNWRWYGINNNDMPGNINLVIVDGPPRKTQKRARFPALPYVYPKLAHDAVIVLDDADRADEIRIARLWLEQYRELSQDEARCGKRFLVLRRD